jgi:hypothetical protein
LKLNAKLKLLNVKQTSKGIVKVYGTKFGRNVKKVTALHTAEWLKKSKKNLKPPDILYNSIKLVG